MSKERKPEPFQKPAKELWDKYSLQSLAPKKFIQVVNRIIRGELRLVK